MTALVKIIPPILYLLIGIISMLMATKCFTSKKFLPFHAAAYGKPWEDIDVKLRHILIAMLRISGLGFLTVALLLLTFPVVNYFHPDPYLKFAIPLIALTFCTGLFFVNFRLYKMTHANTPWKRSIYAMVIIMVAILVSLL